MKIVDHLILVLSIFAVFQSVYSDDDDDEVKFENCEIKYLCSLPVLVDGAFHHCNRYKKEAYICDGEEIPIENEFYDPPREEENEIDVAEDQNEYVALQPIMILTTPCQRKHAPDQTGVCQAIF